MSITPARVCIRVPGTRAPRGSRISTVAPCTMQPVARSSTVTVSTWLFDDVVVSARSRPRPSVLCVITEADSATQKSGTAWWRSGSVEVAAVVVPAPAGGVSGAAAVAAVDLPLVTELPSANSTFAVKPLPLPKMP